VITRIAAAAVGLAVLLPALLWGDRLAVEVLVPAAMALCVYEYAGMAFPEERRIGAVWVGAVLAVLFGATAHLPWLGVAVPGSLALVASLWMGTLAPGAELERAADRVGRALLGAAWIAQLGWLVFLRRLDGGLAWVFLALGISWLGDTGGYFAGRFFGRTPLYPRISPKKTWEGALGGVLAAMGGALAIRAIGLPTVPPAHAALLGAGLCVASIWGDLAESMLKRSFQVKDSGTFLPGHGGILDRIDSVIFVAPLLFLYAGWSQGGG
jgi:phosphatidate cytidylyltransferase